ncbi:Hypothetical predicted protein, partial [Olea europaea subsp. europaea]
VTHGGTGCAWLGGVEWWWSALEMVADSGGNMAKTVTGSAVLGRDWGCFGQLRGQVMTTG